jgi:hypothetical protein
MVFRCTLDGCDLGCGTLLFSLAAIQASEHSEKDEAMKECR